MEVAALGIKVGGTTDVDKARDSLGRFVKSSKEAEGAATAFGRTTENASGKAARGTDNAARAAERMGGAYGRANSALATTATRLAAIAAASIGFGQIVRTLAGFEESMAAVGAITRASTADLARLRDVAKEFGATTEFSASQAADGLKFLGMAGFNAQQSIDAFGGIVNLATASQMGLAQAADTASNIMSGFGMAASEASRVADVLAAVSSRANTDVVQLGSAMSTVAPISAALGISLEDTAAAIGTLSDAGIQGERAGTAMRGVLAALAGPTKEAEKVLRRLGLTTKEVNPQTNDLAAVMDRLRKSGISTADAMTIFGREAASGALVMIQSADRIGEFGKEVAGARGEAQRMADTMRDQLNGDLKGLQSAVESVIIALGEAGLTKVLRTSIQALTDAVRWVGEFITRAGQIASIVAGNLSPALDAMSGALTDVAKYSDIAVVAISGFFAPAVLGGIAKLTVALGVGLVGAVKAVTAAMLANPIGLLVAGLATAAYAVYQFRDTISEVIGTDVIDLAKRGGNIIIGSFVAAFEDIKFVWNNFGDMMGSAVIGGVNIAIGAINKLIQTAASGIDGLIEMIRKIPGMADTPMIGESFGLKEIPNPYSDRLEGATAQRNAAIQAALSRDYIGELAGLFGGDTETPGTPATPGTPGKPSGIPPPPPPPPDDGTGKKLDEGQQYINQMIERVGLIGKETEAEKLLGRMSVGAIKFRTQAQFEYALQLAETVDQLMEQQKLSEDFKALMENLFPEDARIEQFNDQIGMLNQALEKGWIDAERYAEAVGKLQDEFARSSDDFWVRYLQGAEDAITSFDELSQDVIKNFTRGFGDAFEKMVFDSQNLGDAFSNMAEGMGRSFINAVGQMIAQWLVFQAITGIAGLFGGASSIGTGATTIGAGSTAGGAGAVAFPVNPFSDGGWTGPGDKYKPAGIVHRDEFVFSKEATNRIGVANLERMHKGQSVSPGAVKTGNTGVSMTINLVENPNKAGQVERTTDASGQESADVFVADIMGDGKRSQAMRRVFGLQRTGT